MQVGSCRILDSRTAGDRNEGGAGSLQRSGRTSWAILASHAGLGESRSDLIVSLVQVYTHELTPDVAPLYIGLLQTYSPQAERSECCLGIGKVLNAQNLLLWYRSHQKL